MLYFFSWAEFGMEPPAQRHVSPYGLLDQVVMNTYVTS
jgi:hypothetical protein